MKTTERPTLQDFHIDGVQHITPQNAVDAVINGEAIILDVREKYECELESITPEVVVFYLPMSLLIDKVGSIPTDKSIIVMCAHGIRSAKVVNLLTYSGFKNIASLDGGFSKWKSAGLPFKGKL